MLVWEASAPYLYLRMSRDGRLIVGGEDEASASAHGDHRKLRRKSRILAAKLETLLGGATIDIDYGWAGAFGVSATGLPRIAPVEGLPHAWAVMGLGGNGITYSVIAAQVVSAHVRGDQDPDADLYRD
jgi:glycine/D-amino acid oxidase-like deaminating enzyme